MPLRDSRGGDTASVSFVFRQADGNEAMGIIQMVLTFLKAFFGNWADLSHENAVRQQQPIVLRVQSPSHRTHSAARLNSGCVLVIIL